MNPRRQIKASVERKKNERPVTYELIFHFKIFFWLNKISFFFWSNDNETAEISATSDQTTIFYNSTSQNLIFFFEKFWIRSFSDEFFIASLSVEEKF